MKLYYATLVVIGSCALAHGAPVPSLKTEQQPVTNAYHNVSVVDPYQWLEEAGTPAVKEWSAKQNERTGVYIGSLPFRDGIEQQLTQLRGEESARFYGLVERRGRIFAMRFKPPAQQPVLIRLSSLHAPALWKPVLDLNTFDTNGTTSIDWFVPSLDGKLVAVCLSEKGSEDGTLHFFNAETGEPLPDRIPRVQYPTGGGSAAWSGDGKGIFYTRYPHKGERAEEDLNFYQQVWFHKIGTPASEDRYEVGKEFPRIAEIELESSDDGRWTLATVSNGDGGDYAHFVRDNTRAGWRQVTRFEDEVKRAKLGRDGNLYLVSRKGAVRGKLLRLAPSDELARAETVVPEGDGVIHEIAPTDRGVYVSRLVGGPSELLYFPRGKTHPVKVVILPTSTVAGLESWHGDEAVFANFSYVQPLAWYTHQPGEPHPRKTALALTSPANFDDIEVVREFAVSKDGTKVPLNILKKRGTALNGNNPTLLYGYGGYGISLQPGFDSTRRVWFDAGGIYVVANLRGGGEYGETWHKAGNLTRKQTVFDDFIASAEHLIKHRYTSSSKLAVMGGSNGGLLMGAFLTQRPELARAVVSQVGIYDMLRVELDPNGQFNVTEFGSVKDPEQFKALYAYSPYHKVRPGVKYPSVILTTGENDGRVNPSQSRKMAAMLQSATASDYPVLYRSNAHTGHGQGSALKYRIEEQADVFSFLFDQLQMRSTPWTWD
jgi:prolyl oligopeptidase